MDGIWVIELHVKGEWKFLVVCLHDDDEPMSEEESKLELEGWQECGVSPPRAYRLVKYTRSES